MYDVISPDGFSISMEHSVWDSKMKAKDALLQFVYRYKQQGYYSMSDRTRIPFSEIYDSCKIVKIDQIESDLEYANRISKIK